MDIFWESSQNWTIFKGHLYAFLGLFLRSRYRMGDIFGVAKFQIIFWLLEIPDIFLEVKGRCWALAYV